ncbi:hypothetical protein M0804_006738 [Polistes exclamans]|nr:hypothetical protein M0804_006738 [Polistes exclamans]
MRYPLVRGRRDRCPWDARAFLVREAHETNGRRASPDHAFPREKKLRLRVPWLCPRKSSSSIYDDDDDYDDDEEDEDYEQNLLLRMIILGYSDATL